MGIRFTGEGFERGFRTPARERFEKLGNRTAIGF
jgi:hypothetical protein